MDSLILLALLAIIIYSAIRRRWKVALGGIALIVICVLALALTAAFFARRHIAKMDQAFPTYLAGDYKRVIALLGDDAFPANKDPITLMCLSKAYAHEGDAWRSHELYTRAQAEFQHLPPDQRRKYEDVESLWEDVIKIQSQKPRSSPTSDH